MEKQKAQYYAHTKYYANSNTWIIAAIFNVCLIKWDNVIDLKTVLIVDKCIAHSLLKNIIVVYFPANTKALSNLVCKE